MKMAGSVSLSRLMGEASFLESCRNASSGVTRPPQFQESI